MEGRIIEFIEDGKLFCAICLEEKAGRIHLLTSKNKEMNLSLRRVLYASQRRYDLSQTKEALISVLREAEDTRERLRSQIDVRELWEAVNDQEGIGFRDLAELVFGYQIGDEHISAVIRALFEDRVYFKLKENQFCPVSPEAVEEYFQRLEEKRRRSERVSKLRQAYLNALAGQPVEEGVKEDLIQVLKELVLYEKDSKDWELIKEVFQELGGADPKGARRILVDMGVWGDDEDIELLRSGLQRDFPPYVVDEIKGIRRLRGLDNRKDLRDLCVFTIDGPKTRDFDDAISLEKRPGGFRLGIHISDVAAVLAPENRFEQVLMERASSLYLPTRYLPMMPPELSEDGLSLIEGLERPSISLMVDLDREFRIQGWEFLPSLIKVYKQLTYDQVDQLIAYEDDFEILAGLSEHMKKVRLQQGGMDLTLPEVVLAYRPEGRIELFQVDLSSPARRIVQEAMILYNHLASVFLMEQGVPALFRVQEAPTERISEEDMDRILYVFLQRRKLMPLSITTEPGPHVPLGVKSYVQVSSPIRRYLDLVVQRQISALLQGRPIPYDQSSLEQIKAMTEPVLKEQDRVRKASLNYWFLRFFEQNQEKTFHGLVLDDMKSRLRIIIKEALFVVEARREAFKGGVSQGDELLIKIKKVDPWAGLIEIGDAL